MNVEALWITGIGKIETGYTEIRDTPDCDQVQVEIKACGICAWDGALFRGVTTPGPYPFLHGHEGVGYVRSVGAAVKDLKPGDLVMCSEDTPQMMQVQNIARSAVTPIRQEVSEKDLPLWVGEPIVCVVNSLANMKIKPASTVALIGSGYMGLLKIQALMRQLIGELVVFDLDQHRLDLAVKFGADQALLSGSKDADALVKGIQSKGGAELVIECSGSEQGLELANSLMAQSGTLNLFAWHRTSRNINMTPWHQRGYTILNTAPNFDRHYRDHVEETEVLIRRKVFDQTDLITHVSHYSHAQEIMEAAVNKTEGYIKGVITF